LIEVIGGGNKKYLEKRHEVFYAWPTYQKSINLLNYKQNTSLKNGLTEM
jgi:UDP-glucose 4-epimerase